MASSSKRHHRDARRVRAEGVACYREFISGLLDVTDNLVDGAVVPPPDIVRYDDDDPYLVVAADKGTATFSDIANDDLRRLRRSGSATRSPPEAARATTTRRWGSPRSGAWESVRRHARVLGRDADRDPLTFVGIGDMSGDVFGNGMLRSEHIKLVAAFDHRHVFLDPDPDPAASFAERAAAVRAAAQQLGRLRPDAHLDGRRRVPAHREEHRDLARGRKVLGVDRATFTPAELISADPARAGRRAVERRHRHVREGVDRDARRRRRPRQRRRCASTATSCAARWSARAATSASPSADASSTRWPAG